MLEDLGAHDAIEAGGGQVELVDLALHEPDVVAGEVAARGVEEDGRHVDGGEAGVGEETQDVAAAGADLAEVQTAMGSDHVTDDGEPPLLDPADGERRPGVVVVDRVVAGELVVQRLDVRRVGCGQAPVV